MRAGRRSVLQVVDQRPDDCFAEPAPLMFRVDCDINNLESQATIADDAAHADEPAFHADDDGEEGIWQADGGALFAFRAEAGKDAEAPVLVRSRDLVEQLVVFIQHPAQCRSGVTLRQIRASERDGTPIHLAYAGVPFGDCETEDCQQNRHKSPLCGRMVQEACKGNH